MSGVYINQGTIAGWEKNGCGIACVGMVLTIAGKEYTIENLIQETLHLKGYIEGIGWRHAALARTIANRNIPAYSQEFTSPNNDKTLFAIGMKKIKEQVQSGNPVIVSVLRHFNPDATATHLVVITGIADDAFIVQDSDYEEGGENIAVSFDRFAQAWRGFAIFTDIPKQ